MFVVSKSKIAALIFDKIAAMIVSADTAVLVVTVTVHLNCTSPLASNAQLSPESVVEEVVSSEVCSVVCSVVSAEEEVSSVDGVVSSVGLVSSVT